MAGEHRETIAANLKYYRKGVLDMTQKQVAEQTGVSSNAVGMSERGDTMPSLDYLIAFAKLADITIDKICGIERNTIVVEGLSDKDIREIEMEVRRRRGSHKRR